MFSGKSEELIRRLRRAQIARQKVQIFKPLIDNRFSEDHIVSHSDMRIASQNVAQLRRAARAGGRGHRSRRHRRRAVLRRRTCRRRATRWRTAASGSSSPASIRTTSAVRSSRCRSCWRSPNTSPRRSPSAWSAAIRRTTRSGWSRAATACWSARPGSTRRAAATASIRTLADRRKGRSRTQARAVIVQIAIVDVVTGILLLLGVGFLVANARLAARATSSSQAPPRRAADLARPEAAATTALALAHRRRRWASSSFVKLVLVHRQAFGEIDDVRLLRATCCR